MRFAALFLTSPLALTGAASAQQAPVVAAAARANPAAWPKAHSPAAITDAATEKAIDALLVRMTIEQKVGQVVQGDISSVTPADLARYPLGSILAGGNSGPYGDERADAATWARMVGDYRAASLKAGAGVPILFGVDAVHGHSNVPGATIFPHNIGLGATHDPDLILRIGQATAAEIAGSGIEWTFAPTLAVPQDLRWGRSYEGYAADPALVKSYATAMVDGLQGKLMPGKPLGSLRVAATAKHFLADGGTKNGKDQGDAQISETDLIRTHAQGYPAAIDAGALTVMASFSSWNGVKNHGNPTLLTDVLKGRMGFEGLIVGDWNGHGQIPGCTVTDCAAALNAGLDLYMAPDSWKGLFDSLVRDVRAGKVSQARLDDAVRRNLRVKYKLGLMGKTQVERGDPAQLGAPDHLAIAREAVAKSLVLLKNEGSVLPIKPGAKVLVAGAGADNMAMQAGGWTITWQGTDTTAADFPRGQTIGRAIVDAVTAAGGSAHIDAAGDTQDRPDVAIIVFGEQPYAEFQGDAENLLFKNGDKELAMLKAMRARGIPTVAVFLSGRPLFMGPQINAADAFVAAWLPGTQGQGVADVLVAGKDGKSARDFTGRLPSAWPADARSPVAAPLFPMGYGLDYAHPHAQGPVNEDPKVKQGPAASDSLFLRTGKVVDPWRLGIDSSVSARAVDVSAQEDARQFVWTGPGAIAIDGPPVDMTRQLNGAFALRIDWRVDAARGAPITLSLGGARLDISAKVATLPVGKPSSLIVPLRCFADAGATFEAVGTPLRLSANAGLSVSIRSVLTEGVGETPACPPVAK